MKDFRLRVERGLFAHDFRAHPDWPRSVYFKEQHALRQIGWMTAFENPPPLSNPITVAVLDDGVNAADPYLRGVVLPGTSLVSGQAWNKSTNGRGTEVASIIASPANGGAFISGVAISRAVILPVRVIDDENHLGDLAWGIRWAVSEGARVILIPFSVGYCDDNVKSAVRYAWEAGAVIVAAAGDTPGAVRYPASFECVLGVSGTDAQDRLWTSSAYGKGALISAPAVDVLALQPNERIAYQTGTAYAAALVAGAAALLWAYDPGLTNAQIVSRLVRTATPAKDAPGRVNLALAIADRKTESLVPNKGLRSRY